MSRRPDLSSRGECKNGHSFAGDNLYMRGTIRVCKACRSASKERTRRRNGGKSRADRAALDRNHKQLSMTLYPARPKGDSKRARAARKRASNAAFVEELKSGPCVDCGGTFHPCAMDFDHLPGFVKLATVSELVAGAKSRDAIMREIAKCDLVCSNCHRVRTHQRRHECITSNDEADEARRRFEILTARRVPFVPG